jgi:tRNA threonylcarbamoyladenosine biosynthesis protein TsaB
MILLLNTASPICKVTLLDGEERYDDMWQADRQLAKGLLGYLQQQLEKNHYTFADVTGLGVFAGPGSFTGLRIGLTVLNTMADSEHIPIVGATGDDWQAKVLSKLKRGDNERLVLPLYGSEAHITKPRK